LQTSAGNSGDTCPLTMLDHKKGTGTGFRRPRFQLDTSVSAAKIGALYDNTL